MPAMTGMKSAAISGSVRDDASNTRRNTPQVPPLRC